MGRWISALFEGRPWWMNALMVFSGYMAFVYVPWDLFIKPTAQDQEVWFGILFTGWAAKVMAVPHWAVYAAGAYGFRKMRPWMWPWAAVYTAQVSFGMWVWSMLYGAGGIVGFLVGLIAAAPFAALALALWNARPLFEAGRPPLRERYGDWALVTGASAGIGAEFARALARAGISCVLTARREEKLRELASELEKTWGVATRVVAADLEDPAAPDRIAQAASDLEIGLLVNNAGFGYAGAFEKQDAARLAAMVQVNCTAPLLLTKHFLPGMRARRRGGVVMVSSLAGRQPVPLHGVYSATKVFDTFFGEALAVELQGSGVDVLVLEPGGTETEFQRVAGETEMPRRPAPEVVELALDALGRQTSVAAGWFDWLRGNAASRLLPRSLVSSIVRDVVADRIPGEMR